MIRDPWLLNNLSAFYVGPTRRITYSIVLSRRFPTKQLRSCFVWSELADWCEHNEIDTVCCCFSHQFFMGNLCLQTADGRNWWEKQMNLLDTLSVFKENYLFARKISHEHNLSLFAQKTVSCLKKKCYFHLDFWWKYQMIKEFSPPEVLFFCWEGVQGLFWRTPF